MPDPFPVSGLVRIIYERGLQVLRAGPDWIVPSSERLERVEHPATLATAHQVRAVVTDTRLHVPFFQPRRLLDPAGRPMSRARYLKGYVEDAPRRVYKYMVEHHLFCAAAHLGYLAEGYSGLAVLDNTERWALPASTRSTSRAQIHDSVLRHGEAVFTALTAALDASRFLLWRRDLRPPSTVPATVDAVLADMPFLTTTVEPFGGLWEQVGERLVRYRNIGVTHHPFTAWGGRCGTVLNNGDIWETRIDLPDNPGDAPEAFTFECGVDLLEYSWTATAAVVHEVEQVLPAVFALVSTRPPASRWRRRSRR